MNLHEYQAKSLLAPFNVPILPGCVAYTPEEASEAAQQITGGKWVVKAQIHAGGRGKAGGVILCQSLEDVEIAARKLLGFRLVTHQTTASGLEVTRIYIERDCDIFCEYYLAFILNRSKSTISLLATSQGGVNVESLSPSERLIQDIHIAFGVQSFQIRRLFHFLNLPSSLYKDFSNLVEGLYRAYVAYDAVLLEINPLVLTADNKLLLLDAKMSCDENAVYRHPDLQNLFEDDSSSYLEAEVRRLGMSYIKLEGNIACLVNGAGLAMATMDLIHYHGGYPANFLDIGGSAEEDYLEMALNLLCADKNTKSILVNIFGGIIRCDMIARSLVNFDQSKLMNKSIVVRFHGTNNEEGKDILRKSPFPIHFYDDLSEAALKAVQMAKE
jgi:succinyl-CoA synthetase beta subunit